MMPLLTKLQSTPREEQLLAPLKARVPLKRLVRTIFPAIDARHYCAFMPRYWTNVN